MAKPNFGQVFLGGVSSLLQHNTERGLRDLPGNIITQGRLIENQEVATAGTRIPHGLKRRLRGWFLVGQDANATVWETARDESFLSLDASATVTVSIWVF